MRRFQSKARRNRAIDSKAEEAIQNEGQLLLGPHVPAPVFRSMLVLLPPMLDSVPVTPTRPVPILMPMSPMLDSSSTTTPSAGFSVAASTSLSEAVGVSVGNDVGPAVGPAAVGVAVGVSVGTAVGLALGAYVGDAVGAAVGTAVDAAIGAGVGNAVGTGVSHIPESMQMPLSQSLPNTQFRPGAQG